MPPVKPKPKPAPAPLIDDGALERMRAGLRTPDASSSAIARALEASRSRRQLPAIARDNTRVASPDERANAEGSPLETLVRPVANLGVGVLSGGLRIGEGAARVLEEAQSPKEQRAARVFHRMAEALRTARTKVEGAVPVKNAADASARMTGGVAPNIVAGVMGVGPAALVAGAGAAADSETSTAATISKTLDPDRSSRISQALDASPIARGLADGAVDLAFSGLPAAMRQVPKVARAVGRAAPDLARRGEKAIDAAVRSPAVSMALGAASGAANGRDSDERKRQAMLGAGIGLGMPIVARSMHAEGGGGAAPRGEASDTPVAPKVEAAAPAEVDLFGEPAPAPKVVGAEAPLLFPGGTTAGARYRVVEAADLITSHDPFTFQPRPRYPEGVQGRDYARDPAAQRVVQTQAQQLDPARVLDRASSPQFGPPVVTPDGVVVAGNQRGMLLQRARELAPSKFAAYRDALVQRAGDYGLDPAAVAGMKEPVLVRELADPSIDTSDPARLAALNAASDVTETKAKRSVDQAVARAATFASAPESQRILDETLPPDLTLGQFLATKEGRSFAEQLVADRVFSGEEIAQFTTRGGLLNDAGKAEVRRTLVASILDDAAILDDVGPLVAERVESVVPAVLATRGAPDGFDLSGPLNHALEVIADANRNGVKPRDAIAQIDAFTGRMGADWTPEYESRVVALAESLLDPSPAKRTAMVADFRKFGAIAREARVRGESGAVEDMFAASLPTSSEAFTSAVGPITSRATRQAAANAAAAALAQQQAAGAPASVPGVGVPAAPAAATTRARRAPRVPALPPTPPGPPAPPVLPPPSDLPPGQATAAVLATIARGERAAFEADRFLSRAERAYTQVVDETYPLSKLGRAAGTGEMLPQAVAQAQAWQVQARQFVEDELRPILKATGAKADQVRALLKARRGLDLLQRGGAEKTGIDPAVLQQAVSELSADPVVLAGADAMNRYFARLLDVKVRAGVIDPQQAAAIRASEDFYSPFAREWDDRLSKPGAGGPAGGRFFNRSTGVRKMDRDATANAKTIDPFELAVQQAAETYRAAGKQRVTNVVAQIAEMQPNALRGVVRRLANNAPATQGRTVQANVSGERRTYEILDDDLYKAFAAFDAPQQDIMRAVGGAIKRTLQTGVTILPDFAVANVTRDAANAAIQQSAGKSLLRGGLGAASGALVGAATADEDESTALAALRGMAFGTGAGIMAPQVLTTLKAIGHIAGGTDTYKAFLRAGGVTSSEFYPRSLADARKVLAQLSRDGVSVKDIVSPRRWVDGLVAIGSTLEQATRFAKFQQARAAGAALPAAALEAQDVSLRFANMGAATKGLASVTPFWNAKVQGWDKLARMLRESKTYALGAMAITAPTVALWAVNKDDPEYWARPQYERNMFWLVPAGTNEKGKTRFLRIPKPFEVGFLFASLPERLLDFAANSGKIASASPYRGDARPGETLAASALDMARTTVDGTLPVPLATQAALEQTANYDTFRNRPIVTRPELPAEMQEDENTSSLAHGIGQATARIPGIPTASPQRVDHLVRSLTGSAGTAALNVTDRVARATGLDSRPLPSNMPVPLVGRFTTSDAALTDVEMSVRRRLRKADQAFAGFSVLTNRGAATDELQAYALRHRQELTDKVQLREAQQLLDKLTEARRGYRKDPKATRTIELGLLRDLGAAIASKSMQAKPGTATR